MSLRTDYYNDLKTPSEIIIRTVSIIGSLMEIE